MKKKTVPIILMVVVAILIVLFATFSRDRQQTDPIGETVAVSNKEAPLNAVWQNSFWQSPNTGNCYELVVVINHGNGSIVGAGVNKVDNKFCEK
ncbi:hypothetical protein HN643_04560 [Candidatus Falkowbacteria bacterium]|nr:hypothetical protein [Candidatus Falkowbacteria bacterium]MBT5503287.1 hypothetical protein [Candidatus Falkowbacteria bacterium]MBT6574504.1 hypothetical protein [Candidatus Falkowbacteria bacterium]MBT7500912.1 hypothetical protein [Candidatus Falkowbacteria bacterium]